MPTCTHTQENKQNQLTENIPIVNRYSINTLITDKAQNPQQVTSPTNQPKQYQSKIPSKCTQIQLNAQNQSVGGTITWNKDFTHSLITNKAQKPQKELPPTNQPLKQQQNT